MKRDKLGYEITSMLIIAIVVFIIMVLSVFGPQLHGFVQYLTSEQYRMYTVDDTLYHNAFDYLWKGITQSAWSFDSEIIFGTAIFQLLLPFFGTLAAVLFLGKWESIYQLEMSRGKRYGTFLYQKTIAQAATVAGGSFIGFLFYYGFVWLIAQGRIEESVTRPLFTDWFGSSFYSDHRYLYTVLEGILRFLYLPFIYSVFAIGITTLSHRPKLAPLVPLLYYYGWVMIAIALYQINPDWYLYTNPAVIMSSGDFQSLNTTLILVVNSLPLAIGIGVLERRKGSEEI